jgi:ribonuclease P/MRP protein subunit RPP40
VDQRFLKRTNILCKGGLFIQSPCGGTQWGAAGFSVGTSALYSLYCRPWIHIEIAMYADDIKIYNISNQSMALEQDLLAIQNWSCDWLLPLNIDKCDVLHIGNTNLKHPYHINDKELASFDNYLDLGVTVSFDVSWSNHILKITKKANSMLFLLNKVFCKSSPARFAKLYKTYVRSVLEFANCVWTPVLQRDIQLLKSVQRRATRVPFGRSRRQYTVRLSLMDIPSLSARRVRSDLLVDFRGLSSEQSPIRHLFTLHEGGRTRGHSLQLLKDKFVTTARQYFLTNGIFDPWNSLPPEIINCKTADSFKARYDSFFKSRRPDGP